jgi:hypothetical protein
MPHTSNQLKKTTKENFDYNNTPATKLLGPFQTIQYGSHHSTKALS